MRTKFLKAMTAPLTLLTFLLLSPSVWASEADLKLPDLSASFNLFGSQVAGTTILGFGMLVALIGILYGLVEFFKIKSMKAHASMLEVSNLIYETCKTYLITQGKFLIYLQILVGACMVFYFGYLSQMSFGQVTMILFWSVVGILGSMSVAWFGIRVNTYANSRTAFASLKGNAYNCVALPLRAGMSIGVVLICVELILLLAILLFVPAQSAGACFLGFAIGESLGATALRICGGIFTKIADIASDLMKIVFNIKEDDARNPGVIADCAGDNAGDSVGPTADGFETFGVTVVALITFIILAVGTVVDPNGAHTATPEGSIIQAKLIVWMFSLIMMMIFNSIIAYWISSAVSAARFGSKKRFDFEVPLTTLVWITALVTIAMTFVLTHLLLSDMQPAGLWLRLAMITAVGTLGAALIPELTRAFTSSTSRHVLEVVEASREGGASLNVISGLVAGNFAAFWKGMTIVLMMTVAYFLSTSSDPALAFPMIRPEVFAFGLLAFGFLGMAPVTIAVDSFGPVTDNAQSVFELSQIESIKGIEAEIQKDFGFKPDFENGKDLLEANDSAGNTFKATAKPVLIGTAVIGATTMIFSIILKLGLTLELTDARVILGLISGGAFVYWFTGASMQAVSTGAFQAVAYIKQKIRLDLSKASVEASNEVVRICTEISQKAMVNIFIAMFSLTLAFAFFDRVFFVSYLISIAVFGLFQALFMANAGGAWDNAKKVVEVDLKAKGTPLHAACVVGDTVGDPYKDTSSVALNPVIKFTTLFGLLAAEIANQMGSSGIWIGVVALAVGLVFVYRSFYSMRIGDYGVKKA